MSQSEPLDPQPYARTGGAIYPLLIAVGMFGQVGVQNRLIVSGDAAATAARVLASPTLWRLGVAADIVMHVLDVPLILIWYVLLRPVSRFLAQLAVLFTLAQTASLIAFKLNPLIAQFLVGDPYAAALPAAERNALMYAFIKADAYGFGLGLIFFGCACLINGWLVWRSTYLPRVLGALLQIAGVCYLVNSFTILIVPKLGSALFPAILLPAFFGELSVCLWLLIKGVDRVRWTARLSAPSSFRSPF
jgi:hypothetical protein